MPLLRNDASGSLITESSLQSSIKQVCALSVEFSRLKSVIQRGSFKTFNTSLTLELLAPCQAHKNFDSALSNPLQSFFD